ncbi:MAG: hypothetical protein QOJ94_1056 [Sphingomonadales bacterium]|nr:hypothetical protein [Sphingomonadales bacterium]
MPGLLRAAVAIAVFAGVPAVALAQSAPAPTPIAEGKAADWLLVFKLNAKTASTPEPAATRPCPFGAAKPHPGAIGLAYAFATNSKPQLHAGPGLAGTGTADPLGATFSEIWNGNYHFVVWNDQFYGFPKIKAPGCSGDGCDKPWGHSKGVLAWNDAGQGIILQVTTPAWPGAASKSHPRGGEGNTLGCIGADDNVIVSQHFFALKLNEPDVEHVLDALANASVATDVTNPQLVNNGGPPAIRTKVAALGQRSASTSVIDLTLSSGVRMISKPSQLTVPPWQLVSARLGGIPLRVASWWASPPIPSTTSATPVGCWGGGLGKPGAVEIATSGTWNRKPIGFRAVKPDGNHAKIGISTAGTHPYSIFGDMNQQGALSGDKDACHSSQNFRGGLFFVVENQALHDSVKDLLEGCTAPQVLASGAAATTCVVPPPPAKKTKK